MRKVTGRLYFGPITPASNIAGILRERLGASAGKVPTRRLPDIILRIAALFQDDARFMAPLIGRRSQFNTEKAANLLDWRPRPAAEAVLECAQILVRQKLI
jgi:dihydroflavonol-4-reductase